MTQRVTVRLELRHPLVCMALVVCTLAAAAAQGQTSAQQAPDAEDAARSEEAHV